MPHLKLIPAELIEVRRVRAAILAIRYVLATISEVCGYIHATVPCALCAPERHAASDVMYSTIVCSCELIDAEKTSAALVVSCPIGCIAVVQILFTVR